jgi:hypothetical protein
MRQTDEGGPRMKRIAMLLLCALPALAAVSGTVTNGTTGKPQPGATVSFLKIDQQTGVELLEEVKTDAQGAFTINRDVAGPSLIRAAFDGVTYTNMVAPGSPTTGIAVKVFNASKQPGAAKVAKHMILFQPSGGQMAIQETFLLNNAGQTAWNDPQAGTLRFYLPTAANGKAEINATAPGGLPISAPLVKTGKPELAAVDFPIKPGETRLDITYTVPYTEGAAYEGKIVTKDDNSYLIAPNGVTLKGENLTDLGQEPQTQAQAHIYGLQASAYRIELSGAPASPAAADSADSDGSPQIQEIKPRVFGQAALILGLALGILALGMAILYRKSDDAEGN